MPLPRRSGILLHPTSLPGPHGSGDLGASAYHFVDWLVAGKQSLWQVLPLGDVGIGNSPYMSPSAFAGNVLLVDLVQLRDAGWLDEDDVASDASFDAHRVDHAAVGQFRMVRLRKAARRFLAAASAGERAAFEAFCEAERDWLDDYALFRALEHFCGSDVDWPDWTPPLAQRDERALKSEAKIFAEEIAFWKFSQWCFDSQWRRLKAYANERGIEIVGDVPIFVAMQSADVWARRELFRLDSLGNPSVVSGVPPDKFSSTGQRWGNPLYRWEAHDAEGYRWWVARMKRALALYDLVRIDHFRGFEAYWEIPAESESAMDGRWRPGPGTALFEALRAELGTLPFIAEDLGVITPEVNELRKSQGLPGMRILQFAFDFNQDNPYLPHNFKPDTVVYTGTHDNDTTRGWWNALADHERDYVRRYLAVSGEWIHWDMIRAAMSSVAAFAIAPMQDVLGLDSAHRMNRPGLAEGSWGWRFTWDQVEGWRAGFLAEMAQLYGRMRREAAADVASE